MAGLFSSHDNEKCPATRGAAEGARRTVTFPGPCTLTRPAISVAVSGSPGRHRDGRVPLALRLDRVGLQGATGGLDDALRGVRFFELLDVPLGHDSRSRAFGG